MAGEAWDGVIMINMVTPSDISVAVVGHVARQLEAHHLARRLGGRLFLDSGQLGEVENHRRAWAWAAGHNFPWTLVVQDDAIPIPGMLGHLAQGLTTLPQPGLVSLYLGTSYPTHWQARIRGATQRSDQQNAAWIVSDHLLHGVAVAAPTNICTELAAELGGATGPYDEELTIFAQRWNLPVHYTWPSLVDHADGPTLLDHPDGRGRNKPRHAWRTGAPNWNNRTVRL